MIGLIETFRYRAWKRVFEWQLVKFVVECLLLPLVAMLLLL